jgi:hypothetical protein
MRGRIRRVLVAAAVSACVVTGCSDDDSGQPSADDEPSVDEVASSWGEIPPRDEKRTRTYLAGDGAPLTEYADFAAGLGDRLDDAAYEDGCADLQTEWADAYPRRAVVDWLYALPDPILGRLWTSQIPAIEQALDACAGGDRDKSAELAEQAARVQELVDRRLDQLGVAR